MGRTYRAAAERHVEPSGIYMRNLQGRQRWSSHEDEIGCNAVSGYIGADVRRPRRHVHQNHVNAFLACFGWPVGARPWRDDTGLAALVLSALNCISHAAGAFPLASRLRLLYGAACSTPESLSDMGRHILPPERVRRAPTERPPERSMLDAIPVELLHRVVEELEPDDIASARLVCKLLAHVGADHLLEEVKLVHHRGRFERLVHIANDAFFAKQVKSLYYQGNRFDPSDTYDDWARRRKVPCRWADYNVLDETPSFGTIDDYNSERAQRAMACGWKRYEENSKGNFTQAQLDAAYEAYNGFVLDQDCIEEENLDLNCLTTLFKAYPNLEDVTIAIGHGTRGRLDAMTFAFGSAMVTPLGDVSNEDQGVRQFRTICEAVKLSGKQLKSLTATNCSHNIIPQNAEKLALVKDVVRSLHTLRLGITTYAEEEEEAEAMYEDAFARYASGDLREILQAASNLRVLKIAFTMGPELESCAMYIDVLRDLQWNRLREFGVSQFQAIEDQLVDFVLRHKDSLRRLSLSNCDLLEGSWTSLFKRISCKLPKLRKLKLRGRLIKFHLSYAIEEYNFDVPGGEAKPIDVLRDAVTKFVLEGGDWPDTSEVPERCGDFWLEDPEYEPAGWLEDDGQVTDGSDISYGSDAFDAII